MRVNGGADGQASAMGGDVAGLTGTATATTVTSLTSSGFTAGAYIGHTVVASSSGTLAYGVITASTATVLTVDQWYAPASPGGAATTTPSATCTFVIMPGQAPYWYMAITTDTPAPAAADTSLASEITASGSGCIRKLATYTHTTGAASFSLAATYTYTSTDQTFGSRAIAKMGIFNTLPGATGRMQFETAVSPTATLTASGDQLTITDTVSM